MTTRLLTPTAILIATLLALPAMGADPEKVPDDSWISVSGTVAAAADNYFVLDYGDGLITVEMDDWDWYEEGKALISGDSVTVYGRVDDDLYEAKKIEAGSVYVEDLNTYFYASAADEEDPVYLIHTPAIVVSWMEVAGKVTSTDGREFTLDTGKREVKVDTREMTYNPMDDRGYQKISVGDRVKVFGELDYDAFERREIMADSVITLARDKTKKSD